MMKSPLARFLTRSAAYAASLAAVLAAYAFFVDPLRVLRVYPEYYGDGVYVNMSVAGINTFESRPGRRGYDSFILGSSVSKALPVAEWRRFLPESARPYHLSSDAQMVPLSEMSLRYAVANVDSVRHVLVFTTPWSLQDDVLGGALFEPHPHLYPTWWGQARSFARHVAHSLSRDIAGARLCLAIDGRVPGRFGDKLEIQPGLRHDPETNELVPGDKVAYADTASLDAPGMLPIVEVCRGLDSDGVAPPCITPAIEGHLRGIAGIARGCGATLDFVLVRDPGGATLSARDDSVLRAIFGPRYHNMTFARMDEQRDPRNYYDRAHCDQDMYGRLLRDALSASE